MNRMFPFTIMGIAGGGAAVYAFSNSSKSWSKPVAIVGVSMIAFATGYLVYSYNQESDTKGVQKTLSL